MLFFTCLIHGGCCSNPANVSYPLDNFYIMILVGFHYCFIGFSFLVLSFASVGFGLSARNMVLEFRFVVILLFYMNGRGRQSGKAVGTYSSNG